MVRATGLEIGADAMVQAAGLAHVEDATQGVLHEVHPRAAG
jgi:hypothetical protein